MEETSLIVSRQPSYSSLGCVNSIRCELEETGPFNVIIVDHETEAEECINDEPGIDNDTPTFPAKKAGCLRCRAGTTVETFHEVKAGDHIAVRGQVPCIGRCYDHHAIVTDVKISSDSRDVNVTVVDVIEKDMRYTGCRCVSCTFCCIRGKRCSCCTCSYPVRKRQLSQEEASSWISDRNLRRIDYRKRKSNHRITAQKASKMCDVVNNLEYSILFQNCEHAAAACVNASDVNTKEALVETLSVQSQRCCWRIWHVVFWILQTLFYAINFCLYAVYVAKDEDFHNISHTVKHVCVFDAACERKMVAIFSVMFLFIFLVTQAAFYQPLYIKGYICRQCLITSRLDCFSRVFAFVLVEVISMFLQNPLYRSVTAPDTGEGIQSYAIIIGISLIGTFMIYSVSNLITWALGACCIPSCHGVREFTRYFKFRGLPKFILFIIRQIKRALRVLLRKVRPTLTNVIVHV